MHIYSSGYNKGTDSYPVFISYMEPLIVTTPGSTVGQAGLILDNLIADGKAKPMIVVMLWGIPELSDLGPEMISTNKWMSLRKISRMMCVHISKPTIELSMIESIELLRDCRWEGHTLWIIAFTKLGDYAYVGVFSSGIFGIDRPETNGAAEWMEKHKECLNKHRSKDGLS